jgi:hypothetical protein
MAIITSAFWRDANGVPITTDGFIVSKSMTFAGGTTNDPGDYDGTGNPATLFTVTGDVLAHVFGICTVDLTGDTATVEVGVASGTALLIAQTTATGIDAPEAWIDNAAALVETLPHAVIIGGGQDIIQTVATANITAGAITYYCIWRPISVTGNIVAA